MQQMDKTGFNPKTSMKMETSLNYQTTIATFNVRNAKRRKVKRWVREHSLTSKGEVSLYSL